MIVRNIMEAELRHFWQCSLEARRSAGVSSAMSVQDARDELEVVAEMTDWPRLREACRATARSLEERPQALAAVS
jgi:hypothetical protein